MFGNCFRWFRWRAVCVSGYPVPLALPGIVPLWWSRRLRSRSGATSPGSNYCFEDQRNGLSKRPSTASVHPAGIGSNISLVCSPARAGKRDPAHPRKSRRGAISGSPRSGDLRLDERKETLVFKVRGEAAVEIIKAGSEDEGIDPSLAFVESCPRRFDERAVVVTTLFGPDGEEMCDFDFRALHGRIAPMKNMLSFASAFRSGRPRRASRSRRSHGTRGAENLF